MPGEKKKRKTVLVISFWFPPTNAIGAVTVSKKAKYLPYYGWDPVILTVNEVKRGIPKTLAAEIEESRIVRTPYWGLADSISTRLVPEEKSTLQNSSRNQDKKYHIYNSLVTMFKPVYHLPLLKLFTTEPAGWYTYAVKKGLDMIRDYKVDAILSSYWPSTSHLIAACLQKRTGIPWIAEYRDLWSLEPYYPKTQPFQSLEVWLEKLVMKRCSLMTTVSEPWAGQLKDIHRKRVEVITNGYDPEDYEKEEPTTAKFTITHTGHLQSWDEKQIPQLFMAAADLQREGRLSPDTFEIRFFGGDISGSSSSFIPQLAKKYALENLVSVHDYVPYQHSIKMQKESTVLFLSRSTDPVGGVGVFSAKIYEYLGAKRPIMAMALKGDVIDKFLKETGAGIVANEKEEIKSVLSTWVDEFERKGDISAYFNPDNEVIKQSTYRMQAEKLAALLDEITVSKP